MSNYKQVLTLTDIFNDKKLAGKLPLINYKESVGADGKEHRTTKVQSIVALVFGVSKAAAKPFYHPMTATRHGNGIDISGKLVGDFDAAADAVYNQLVASKGMMSITVNNIDMVRTALKEGQKQKRENGAEPKLWLRAGSLEEIENMSSRQIHALMDNIMENIYYGDDFQKTAKKYGVDQIPIKSPYTYEERKAQWQRRIQ